MADIYDHDTTTIRVASANINRIVRALGAWAGPLSFYADGHDHVLILAITGHHTTASVDETIRTLLAADGIATYA